MYSFLCGEDSGYCNPFNIKQHANHVKDDDDINKGVEKVKMGVIKYIDNID